jgi:chorismate synthase
MRLVQSDIQKQLDRRRPGQSKITTQRNEKDQAIILSGIEVREREGVVNDSNSRLSNRC